ncbi:MAG: alanine dehydrogenase [gamma proteobacterium symbiont of Taylorina sp.]|nr:alanine dehydrogenase [gamma proteobacterium symbiont of Taylorina sp.]
MYIGIVKEIKDNENRVAVTPDGVKMLIEHRHHVMVEKNAGTSSGFTDHQYQLSGAVIADTDCCWDNELVLKVKEPIQSEYKYLRQQIIFAYLHLAAAPVKLIETLLLNKTTAIAYETLEDKNAYLPLLAPMSAIAGNMATLVGCYYLAGFNGGKGVQPGIVLNEKSGQIVIIGDGIVAQHAARVALGMGSFVSMATRRIERKEKLRQLLSPDLNVFNSSSQEISQHIKNADVVIGAALNRGARTPHLISENMIKEMQSGSVVVDVSIDQGGCFETSHPTTHSNPVFVKHDIIHYCVSNMPGAFPKTSTIALSKVTLPYILKLADKGLAEFAKEKGQSLAVNCCNGFLSNRAVALSVDMLDKFRSDYSN